MRYKMKETPTRFGIIYTESRTKIAETVWYETEYERDLAVSNISKTGELEIESGESLLGRVVKVSAYTKIKADDEYYISDLNNEQK